MTTADILAIHQDCTEEGCFVAWDQSACPFERATERVGTDLVEALICHVPKGYARAVELVALLDDAVLELTGSENGKAWVWIVRLVDGRYAYARGGCDYTGWRCDSMLEWHEAGTLQTAIRLAEKDTRLAFEEMMATGEKKRQSMIGWP